MNKLIIVFLGMCLLLTSCVGTQTPAPTFPTVTTTPPSSGLPVDATPAFTRAPTQTPNPAYSPTPDLRLPPEQWQDWPIVPEISPRASEIYLTGLAMGNNPRAFSKIGDCQNVPEAFLGIYDVGGYSFSPGFEYLQESVEHYSGSFNREGEAVRGGFNASSVLLPLWANAKVCQPGENPMECENRIHNPSVVIISLEVWFAGRTEERYEKYMREIIEYNISQGTLPILSTKADNVEGNHFINYTSAKLAYEYDLPLWNFWRAAQPLPNNGLDPADETGFHLNLDGWNMRSFTALQVLDAVRRTVEGSSIGVASGGHSVTATSTPLAVFTPGAVTGLPHARVEASANPLSEAYSILLGISTRSGNESMSEGIFQGSLNGKDWQSLTEAGITLLDHSEAGTLIMQGNSLYLLKGGGRTLLTSILRSDSPRPAIWLADGRIAAILRVDEKNQVAILNPGGDPFVLPDANHQPLKLHPSRDPAHIYWSAGTCIDAVCKTQDIFISKLDGSGLRALPHEGQPAFASDGRMAFMTNDAKGKNQLTLINGEKTHIFPVPGNRLVEMSWSPDGETLAVSTSLVSNYSGRVLESRLFFVTPPATLDAVYYIPNEALEQHIWSPDGKSMLFIHRRLENGEYRLHFEFLNTVTQVLYPASGFQLVGEKYLLLQPVFWLP
jgi:hypothetical protein